MKKSHVLQRLVSSVVAVVALLSVLVGTVEAAPVFTTSGKNDFTSSKAFTARPLWKYAQKIANPTTFVAARTAQLPPCLNSAVPPRCFSPQQIRAAYNVDGLLKAGITGKGRTVVIIDGSTSPTLLADVHLYDLLYGLKDPRLNVITPFGLPAFDPNAYAETALDVETVHAIAPDATIDLVLADTSTARSPADFLSILLGATRYAVDNNLGDVITQSYGVGETCVGSAYLQAEHQVFSAARAKHITVLASSGDSGAAGLICNGATISEGLAVSLPASDPLVTSVGGTTLNADVKTGRYISETTWNEDTVGNGATGGGFSFLFPRPSYQNGVSGAQATRGVPDVAWVGDPLTGVPVVLSIFGATEIVPFGGTSVGSPAWAAVVALANQAAGKRLGFLNSAIYRILQSKYDAKGFHDITTGNNSVTLFNDQGKPVPLKGYSADPGWDAVTGVGTPKVSALAPLLEKYVKSDDGNGL